MSTMISQQLTKIYSNTHFLANEKRLWAKKLLQYDVYDALVMTWGLGVVGGGGFIVFYK